MLSPEFIASPIDVHHLSCQFAMCQSNSKTWVVMTTVRFTHRPTCTTTNTTSQSAGNDKFMLRRKVAFGVVQQAERIWVSLLSTSYKGEGMIPNYTSTPSHPTPSMYDNFRIDNKLFTGLIKIIPRNPLPELNSQDHTQKD